MPSKKRAKIPVDYDEASELLAEAQELLRQAQVAHKNGFVRMEAGLRNKAALLLKSLVRKVQ